jgi:D-glycero-D-manno-heptose 1,7-bisphosphate phosphatase
VTTLRPAVLLDRDGVLNRDSADFIKTPEELVLLPGSAEAVARLNRAGYVMAIITNQSGIGRGLFSGQSLLQIHKKLVGEIMRAGGAIDGIFVCPHHPDDGCECRKPKPTLLNTAVNDLELDPKRTWYVGDKTDDVLCGQAAGLKTILVLSGKTQSYDLAEFDAPPTHVAPNLSEAVDWLLTRRDD